MQCLMCKISRLLLCYMLPLFWCPMLVIAMPWAHMSDTLKHDLILLNQQGVLSSSVATWPVSWGDVLSQLSTVDSANLSDNIHPVFRRVYKEAVYQSRIRHDGYIDISFANERMQFRDFADEQREDFSLTVGQQSLGKYHAFQSRLSWNHDAQDAQSVRYDGSYAAWIWNNWALGLGKQARWWGPGWSSSLILGNNARPVTSFFLERNRAEPFESAWLSWLGRWNLQILMGKLDDERWVDSPYLFGLRLTAMPTTRWEIAFSRTAMWGGEGRPQSFSSFIDLVAGIGENADTAQQVAAQPGNQLGGLDVTYRYPLSIGGVSAYTQLVGEDESGGLPSRLNGLIGIDLTYVTPYRQWLYYLEYQDTRSGALFSDWRKDYAYEHQVYQSGYRYYGQSLASHLDNDSTAWQLGVGLQQNNDYLGLTVAYRKINIDESQIPYTMGGNPISGGADGIWSLRLQGHTPLFKGRLRWNIAGYQRQIAFDDYQYDKWYVQLGWSNH